MIVGVPRETFPGERRVALVPSIVPSLAKAKLDVLVESDAGLSSGATDAEYREKGAQIAWSRADLFARADIVAQVRTLGANPEAGRADLPLLRRGQILVGMADPLGAPEAARTLAERGATLF